MKVTVELAKEVTHTDRGSLLPSAGVTVDLQMIWFESTCADDPDALGLYPPGECRIIVNLKNVYRDAVRMVPKPEGSMIGTLIHLHGMWLIHELVHWCTGSDEKHENWNQLILSGLVIRLCEESRQAQIVAARFLR
jgi:hypothetical protein